MCRDKRKPSSTKYFDCPIPACRWTKAKKKIRDPLDVVQKPLAKDVAVLQGVYGRNVRACRDCHRRMSELAHAAQKHQTADQPRTPKPGTSTRSSQNAALKQANAALVFKSNDKARQIARLQRENHELSEQVRKLKEVVEANLPDRNRHPTEMPGAGRSALKRKRAERVSAISAAINRSENRVGGYTNLLAQSYGYKWPGGGKVRPDPTFPDGFAICAAAKAVFGVDPSQQLITAKEMHQFRYASAYGATHDVMTTIWRTLTDNMKKCCTLREAVAWRDALQLPDVHYSGSLTGITTNVRSLLQLIASNQLLWGATKFPASGRDTLFLALSGDGVGEAGSWKGRNLNHFELRIINQGRLCLSPYIYGCHCLSIN